MFCLRAAKGDLRARIAELERGLGGSKEAATRLQELWDADKVKWEENLAKEQRGWLVEKERVRICVECFLRFFVQCLLASRDDDQYS